MFFYQIELTRKCECGTCRLASKDELKNAFFEAANGAGVLDDVLFFFDERITFSYQKEGTSEIVPNEPMVYKTTFLFKDRKEFVMEIVEAASEIRYLIHPDLERGDAREFFEKMRRAKSGKHVVKRFVFEYRHGYPYYFFELKDHIVNFLIKLYYL